MVDFMVDTGSLFSAITEKEAVLMGLDCSRLPESKIGAIGFGGTFTPKMMNRLVKLTFKSDKNEHTIRFSSGFMVISIPPTVEDKYREEMLRFTPNVLGMDILVKFEVYMDKRKVELTLIHP